ncbi:hypothetical protein Q8F55_003240 [Vanrija albida]|uniref:F-box domain-containing protein n=1 Tax=Vanrija albida TaxID=181172 RepID=A0ABR3QBW6_9TREE
MEQILDRVLVHCDYDTLVTFGQVSKAARKKVDDQLLRHAAFLPSPGSAWGHWHLVPPASRQSSPPWAGSLPRAPSSVFVLDLPGTFALSTVQMFTSVHTIRRWGGTQNFVIQFPATIPMLVDYVDLTLNEKPMHATYIPTGTRLSITHVKYPHASPQPCIQIGGRLAQGDSVIVLWPCGPPPHPRVSTLHTKLLLHLFAAIAQQHLNPLHRITIVGLEKVHPFNLGPIRPTSTTPEAIFSFFAATIKAIYRAHVWNEVVVAGLIQRTRLVTHERWAAELGNVIGTEWEDDELYKASFMRN